MRRYCVWRSRCVVKLEHTFKEFEYRLITKFGTMLVVAVGVLAAIIKFC